MVIKTGDGGGIIRCRRAQEEVHGRTIGQIAAKVCLPVGAGASRNL